MIGMIGRGKGDLWGGAGGASIPLLFTLVKRLLNVCVKAYFRSFYYQKFFWSDNHN